MIPGPASFSSAGVLDSRTRALLDRYSLSSRVLNRDAGDRMAREAGQSVEFHDFRQYQPGDELRHVDWRAYARTGRLYTRLHQAERTIRLHLLLDDSRSMSLFGKREFMLRLAQLLTYVAQRDSRLQVHSFSGGHSRTAQGVQAVAAAWEFMAGLGRTSVAGAELMPVDSIRNFALQAPPGQGASLLLIISDLLDPVPLRPALAALRARGFDATFLQVTASEDLEPDEALLDLLDSESEARLEAGPREVRAYREAVRAYNAKTRAAILQAGYRHLRLHVPPASEAAELEQLALASLLRSGVIFKG